MAQQRKKNKPQLRTAETVAKILDAAQEIFSEQGFEKTQLEEVAARAGYSRGAIYAHYTSKEDVFLALMEQRVLTKYTAMRQALEIEPIVSKRLAIFKQWLGAQVSDQSWGTLMLEFKLYALRRPESRDKLLKLYEKVASSSVHDLIKLLFGDGLSNVAEKRCQPEPEHDEPAEPRRVADRQHGRPDGADLDDEHDRVAP